MDFWIALALCLLSVGGLVFSIVKLKTKKNQLTCIAGIIAFGLVALTTAGYAALTLLMISGIK